MTMNGAVLPIMAFFIVAAKSRVWLRPTVGNGPERHSQGVHVRNTYIYPPAPSMRIVADIIAYSARKMPRFNSISISGYHMQEAGATAVQELGFTLADGLEYCALHCRADWRSMYSRPGCRSFCDRHGLLYGGRQAARRTGALGRAHGPVRTRQVRLADVADPLPNSGVSLTEQDPYNNVVRTTVEALARSRGTQSLHTNSFDEAIALRARPRRASRVIRS